MTHGNEYISMDIDYTIFCPLMGEFCHKKCPVYVAEYVITDEDNEQFTVKPHCVAVCLLGE